MPKHKKVQDKTSSSTAQKCPDGCPELVWNMLLEIRNNTAAASQRVDKLEERVDVLEQDYGSNDGETRLLSAKVSRLEITTARLRNEVRDLKQHSMKYNLVFSFDNNSDAGREVEGENTIAVIRQFLSQVMSVPGAERFFIPVAHRLGGKHGRHRAILAKFPIAEQS